MDFPTPPLKPCGMIDHLRTVGHWQAANRRACLATLVRVDGSAPRDPGATMVIAQDGEIAGSITGGCIEAALVEESAAVFAQGRARITRFGLPDEQAHAIGLSCGGMLDVFLDEPEREWVRALCDALEHDAPLGIALRLDGAAAGARLALFPQTAIGSLGDRDLDQAACAELRAQGADAHCTRSFGEQGEPHGDVRVFLTRFARKPRMYVFGAVDFAAAMLRIGKLLGYEAILCDARPAFATRARFPEADRIEVAWPDDVLAREPVDERSAIIAMTHDEKFDLPLLRAALATPAGYIGVMGSRSTNERRFAQLREEGVDGSQLDRMSAPAGLDIGGRTPEEIALSIAGELVAVRNGRGGGRLKHARGPLRGRRSNPGDPGAAQPLEE